MISRIAILALLSFLALGLTSPDTAEAQCRGWFCADVHVHVGPPRRRVVVVRQQPPPPPRVVYVQPPPPPQPTQVVVVHRQQVQQVQVVEQQYQHAPRERQGEIGLHAHVGAFVSDRLKIGGVSGALRFRRTPRFALDLGVGIYGGTDYYGLDRVEVPVSADLLVFFNPQHRFQVYGLAGVGVSWAAAEGTNQETSQFESREFIYVGGQAGLGLEFRIGPHFAINADIRGFVRQRVNEGDSRPEFVDMASGETSNTSAGALGTLGATFYF